MLKIADKNKNIIFGLHAIYGREILPTKKIIRNRQDQTVKYSHFFSDNYNSSLHSKSLISPFWDSIFNVLSVYHSIYPYNSKITETNILCNNINRFTADIKRKKNDLMIYQKIDISWENSMNLKITRFGSDEFSVLVNHSQMTVSDENGQNLECFGRNKDRLTDHYSLVLEDALNGENFQNNFELTKKIIFDVLFILDKMHI